MATRNAASGRVVAGSTLLVAGLFILAGQILPEEGIGLFAFPVLGLGFLAWGAIRRSNGLLIPGGILMGLGLGIMVLRFDGFVDGGEAQGGAFLVAFACGWVLIALFSAVFTDRLQLWPLIPGAIIGSLGGALLAGGSALDAVKYIGNIWPIVLIALGLYLIFRRQSREA